MACWKLPDILFSGDLRHDNCYGILHAVVAFGGSVVALYIGPFGEQGSDKVSREVVLHLQHFWCECREMRYVRSGEGEHGGSVDVVSGVGPFRGQIDEKVSREELRGW